MNGDTCFVHGSEGSVVFTSISPTLRSSVLFPIEFYQSCFVFFFFRHDKLSLNSHRLAKDLEQPHWKVTAFDLQAKVVKTVRYNFQNEQTG